MIPDARASAQFALHPMVVGPPGIRLYAGAPLTTVDGHNLGTICVMDTEPRVLTGEEVAVLADLAGIVMDQLDQRMARLQLSESERMRREARRHSQRMEELERVKSEFLLLASHELRGPVATVKGYASMISEGSLGAVPQHIAAVMPIMTAKISEIERLIQEMLASARLEEGNPPIERLQFDLLPAVLEVADGMAEIAEIGPRFQLRLPPDPLRVTGDPAQVAVIVSNLLGNAIKFSPAGGDVTCSLRAAKPNAVLEVIDNGLGIAKADLPRLFTRFGRLVTAENSHIQGSGLGLWLSRTLARRMGGDVTVESALGVGSTFRLALPLA